MSLPPADPAVFAALGDPTRLSLVARLLSEPGLSTTALSDDAPMSRQAVAKHLVVLASAGLVRSEKDGRERRWTLDARPLEDVAAWARAIRREWEARFDRLDALLDDIGDES